MGNLAYTLGKMFVSILNAIVPKTIHNLIYCIFYLGMEKLTLVQNLSLPLITAGFDCLIKSQTGSGKTLAYGIPLVQQLAAVEPKVIYSGVMSSGRIWLD